MKPSVCLVFTRSQSTAEQRQLVMELVWNCFWWGLASGRVSVFSFWVVVNLQMITPWVCWNFYPLLIRQSVLWMHLAFLACQRMRQWHVRTLVMFFHTPVFVQGSGGFIGNVWFLFVSFAWSGLTLPLFCHLKIWTWMPLHYLFRCIYYLPNNTNSMWLKRRYWHHLELTLPCLCLVSCSFDSAAWMGARSSYTNVDCEAHVHCGRQEDRFKPVTEFNWVCFSFGTLMGSSAHYNFAPYVGWPFCR